MARRNPVPPSASAAPRTRLSCRERIRRGVAAAAPHTDRPSRLRPASIREADEGGAAASPEPAVPGSGDPRRRQPDRAHRQRAERGSSAAVRSASGADDVGAAARGHARHHRVVPTCPRPRGSPARARRPERVGAARERGEPADGTIVHPRKACRCGSSVRPRVGRAGRPPCTRHELARDAPAAPRVAPFRQVQGSPSSPSGRPSRARPGGSAISEADPAPPAAAPPSRALQARAENATGASPASGLAARRMPRDTGPPAQRHAGLGAAAAPAATDAGPATGARVTGATTSGAPTAERVRGRRARPRTHGGRARHSACGHPVRATKGSRPSKARDRGRRSRGGSV